MKREPDLADRVTAIERRVVRGVPGRPGAFVRLGGPLLFILLTANLWMLWGVVDRRQEGQLERHFWVVCQPGASGAQRREAFTALLRAGNREWRSARLKHLKLRGADFEGAELELANLEGSDLTDANLKSAKLHGSILGLTKLSGADLSDADLSESFLRKSDLTETDFSRADLRSASLEQSDLADARFERADLTEANLLLAVLTRADLRQARLAWANLDAADFTCANLEGANLESASMRDTFFGDSNWWRARGLPAATLDRFQREFAPTEDAPAAFREDYRVWLRGKESPGAGNSS